MKTALFTAALASTAGASILGRSVSDVMSDIKTISTNLDALTSAFNALTSNLSTALMINTAAMTLDASIKKGTSDAQGTTGVSDSDAQSIIDSINSLIPNVVSAVNAYAAKSGTLSSLGVNQLATSDIGALQSDTNAFASALISVAPSDKQAQATAAASCIAQVLSSAVAGSSATNCAASATGGSGSSGSSSSAPVTSGSTATTATSGSHSSSATSSSASAAGTTGAASGSYGSAGGLFGIVVAAVGLVI